MKTNLTLLLVIASFGFFTSAPATANSPETGAESHGGDFQEHRDNSALYPPKKADPSKATPPAAVTLSEPHFMAKVDGNVSLKWEASTGANVYHVQIATDPNFKWLVTEDHNVQGTSFEVSGLKPQTKYFWRVAAWKADNMAGTNKSAFRASSFETK